MKIKTFIAIATLGVGMSVAQAADATYSTKTLTPETALIAAQNALDFCRDSGYQVAVVVTDRAGLPIALLRDRYAGAHTPETATRKAYTAASFRMDTTSLGEASKAGEPSSGVRQVTHVLALGGGLPIEAAGSLVGAIGVSGAPGADADDACGQAGIDAIQDDLDF